jgi:hypothetical protein
MEMRSALNKLCISPQPELYPMELATSVDAAQLPSRIDA